MSDSPNAALRTHGPERDADRSAIKWYPLKNHRIYLVAEGLRIVKSPFHRSLLHIIRVLQKTAQRKALDFDVRPAARHVSRGSLRPPVVGSSGDSSAPSIGR